MNAFSSLAVPFARAFTPRRNKAGELRRAALIPPAMPGSLGDVAMLSASSAFLRRKGFGAVDLMFGKDWPLDAPIDRRINAERFFYKGSDLHFASLIPRLAAYSHAYFVGADVVDGAYNPGSVRRRLAMLAEVARLGGSSTVLGSSFNAHPEPSCVAVLRALPAEIAICARDPVSRGRMEQFLDRPIRQVADLAFLLEPRPDHPTAADALAWITERRTAGDRVIGLNANYLHAEKHPALPAALPNLLKALLRADVSVLLVPHDIRTGRPDAALLAAAAAELPEADRGRVRMIAPESPAAIKAALARLDLIVTGRMHAAILAMGGGTPAFSFAYQDKFEGLLTLFGLQSADLLSTPEDLIAEPAAVAEKALAHLDNAPALRARIEAHLPTVTALAEQNFV